MSPSSPHEAVLLQFGNGVEVSGRGGCVTIGLRSVDDHDHEDDGEHDDEDEDDGEHVACNEDKGGKWASEHLGNCASALVDTHSITH